MPSDLAIVCIAGRNPLLRHDLKASDLSVDFTRIVYRTADFALEQCTQRKQNGC